MQIDICKSCNKKFVYDRKKGHRRNYCRNCISKDFRTKIKVKAVELLGGKCMLCGYDKSLCALEFHHLNPKEKDFKISSKILSWEKIKPEVKKCVLLCSNCHKEVEYGVVMLHVD